MVEPVKIAEFARRPPKSPAAFRTISEVAGELAVPPHVLRFWESKFSQIKPLKRGGGRRYYRPTDIDLLRQIRELLYTEGYTIKGVQKLLREGGDKSLGGGSVVAVVGRIGARTAAPAGAAAQAAPPSVKAAHPSTTAGDDLKRKRRTEIAELLVELEALRDLLRRPAIE
jgi:DNA-binding transcriptional MerR regulator